MTADVIAWLRSPEGEEWSRSRASCITDPAPRFWIHGPGDVSEDPCGRPPLGPEDAATEKAG